jgi:uncharacterized Zn-binding protein involved in type VI secretion
MAKVVRLGDSSSHGGTMISAGSSVLVNGIPMCISGDSHSCPIDGHGVTGVTGTAGYTSKSLRGIKTGDVAGCGAVIVSGSQNTSTD